MQLVIPHHLSVTQLMIRTVFHINRSVPVTFLFGDGQDSDRLDTFNDDPVLWLVSYSEEEPAGCCRSYFLVDLPVRLL